MTRKTAFEALEKANPVIPPARGAQLDPRARAQLADYVPAAVLTHDADPARPTRRFQRARPPLSTRYAAAPRPLRIGALVGAAAAVAAGAALIGIPGGAGIPGVPGLGGSIPSAHAETLTGVVLQTSFGGLTGENWSGSALAELTEPDGTKRVVRAWSKTGQLSAAEGDQLSYSKSGDAADLFVDADGAPLFETLPGVAFAASDAEVELTIESDSDDVGGAVAEGWGGGAFADAYRVTLFDGDGAELTTVSGVVAPVVSKDGVEIAVALQRRGDDTVFFAQSTGGDFDKAKAVLEALSVAPNGEWADPAAAGEILSPAGAEAALADSAAPLNVLDGDGEPGVTITEEDGVISVTDADDVVSGQAAAEEAEAAGGADAG
ncbi:MAG: hypothetical protein LBD97_05460 [Bifidobacteriaceae bacterium]|jgi:hypothetical protein|nr:hypothetical protein [Bifidobacteriaceae bacterium]